MVPDYYAMLGVDSGADRAAVEAALARQQPAWSSGTRNPKNKHTFQSYLDQIPTLRKTLLGDPAARAAYDAELAAAGRVERDQKLDRLQHLIRLRAAKGGLTVADRTLLRAEAVAAGLTPDDLDRLAEAIPPRPEAPAEDDAPDPPADLIDSVARRQIRVALEHLRRRDLYDALGMPRDAPGDELAARSDSERQRWMHKAQVTAEKTAWLEVISLAQSHLATRDARSRYDRTLEAEAEEKLGQSIEFALKGLSRLDPGTRHALIDEAAALGIAPGRAERLIGRACRKLGVARESSPSTPAASNGPPRLLRCRSCSGVTDFALASRSKKAPECRHCGASLHWACPVCRRVQWVDKPRCACGFRLELREPLVRHFEAAQHAFKTRDFEAARRHLERVLEFSPHHAGGRNGIAKLSERQAEIHQSRAAWELACASNRLMEARQALGAWVKLDDPSRPEIKAARDQLAQGLREAQSLAVRARDLESTDPKAARALYRRSLALAADLPDALAGLRRCPPDPPLELHAEYVGDRVKLRWTPPAADGLGPLTFAVVRKQGTALQHPRDGARIAEVEATSFEDVQVSPGDALSYAVLSKRGEVESLGAVSLGPIYLLGDVTDVRVEVRSHEVDLFWTPPPQAAEVRVVRKRGGPPSGPRDGDRVESLRDQAHDQGLEEDRVYHYGLFALYKLPDGRLVPAPGAFVSAQPHPPILPLDAPSLTRERAGRVRLEWPPPARGSVKVLRSTKPIPHAPGVHLTPIEADSLEGRWLDVAAPDHAEDPSPPGLGACWYTVLTARAGTLTVGHAVAYSCVPDPSDLRATRIGNGRVHLRWRWSPQGAESLVVYRSGTPPSGPNDPLARSATVHEGEYSRQGHFTLLLPPSEQTSWHVRVYSVATVGGERTISPGLEPSARTVVPGPHPEVTVSYEFRRARFPNRQWSLTFRTDPAGSPIPPTALVTHPRTVPLSADDGEIVAQFPASSDGATFPIPSLVDLATHRTRVFADPRVSPDNLPPIRLRHPETAPTRV